MVMHLEEVEICNFEEVDLKGATVIAGFPSIGLVSTIAANYLIDALNLKQIGCVTSAQFPALSVVHTGEPLSPVRISAGEQGYIKKELPEEIYSRIMFLLETNNKPISIASELRAIYTNSSRKDSHLRKVYCCGNIKYYAPCRVYLEE